MYKKLGVTSSIPFSRVQVQLSSLPYSIEEEEENRKLLNIFYSLFVLLIIMVHRGNISSFTLAIWLSFEKIQRCNTIPPLCRPSK